MPEIPIDTGTQPPDEYIDTPLDLLRYAVDDLSALRACMDKHVGQYRLLQDSLEALVRDAIANPLYYVSADYMQALSRELSIAYSSLDETFDMIEKELALNINGDPQ